jgi:hypothetical protein
VASRSSNLRGHPISQSLPRHRYDLLERRRPLEVRVQRGSRRGPRQIRIRYSGAGVPAVQPDGSLSLAAGDQSLIESAPYIYQEFGGRTATVEGRYAIRGDGSVGFALGHYDPARTLIIDPLMTYSTLVGTNDFNAATAIAVDSCRRRIHRRLHRFGRPAYRQSRAEFQFRERSGIRSQAESRRQHPRILHLYGRVGR